MGNLIATTKLKEIREDRGYTQAEMANYLTLKLERNVAINTYQQWERGDISITAETVIELCRIFKVSTTELVTRL